MVRSGSNNFVRNNMVNKKKSYIHRIANRSSTLEIEDNSEDEEDVAVVQKCTNSTTSFKTPVLDVYFFRYVT
jgi:hypothetical protein